MSIEGFKDAGYTPKAEIATPPKIYPKFCVDLDQFPDLEAGVDEYVDLRLRGRVCSRNHSDYGNTMDLEVMALAKDAGSNEADKALGKLKSSKRY